MKIFKFGGASIKDSKNIKNVGNIIKNNIKDNGIIIVSAVQNVTNILEDTLEKYLNNKSINNNIQTLKNIHLSILEDILSFNYIVNYTNNIINTIPFILKKNKNKNYSFLYDQLIPLGEILSSKILSEYLIKIGISNVYLKAKEYIKTNDQYRIAQILWNPTINKINKINKNNLYVTQGFIGYNDSKQTYTTLGREGSDYSASIFANCINATSVIIWKDVDGIMSGDPKYTNKAKLINNISYEEVVELSYYGATIIHPNAIYPLKIKSIPLIIKSFINPKNKGTIISSKKNINKLKIYSIKKNQKFLIISKKDCSIIKELEIINIISIITKLNISITLLQKSATSLQVCFEDILKNTINLTNKLQDKKYLFNLYKYVSIHTIINFDKEEEIYCKNEIIRQYSSNKMQKIINDEFNN